MPALSTAELRDVAASLAADVALWRPHVHADPSRRTFHALRRDPDVTVWLICWMPGHDTGFHDHDGAAGAVAVVQGSVVEERLRLDGSRPVEYGPGQTLGFGPADIHRVAHATGAPAVTIHAYSPALRRMGAYVRSPDGVLLRHALDEDVELRAEPVPA
ncbi:MAG TPA: cysteine dioxygenase family protein [Solirubrobacteraceae bacterium]|jgi:predicted metal-dependent enzyme (double-stranded beta helix superfamily)